MKNPKLSEIRARTKRACEKGQYHYFPAASHALFHDIPDLLDLVKRLGKALEPLMGKDALFCDRCCVTIESDGSITHDEKCFIPEARALLLEIKE